MNSKIENVERRTGYPTDCYWATMRKPNGRRFCVTYDIIGKRMIVDRGCGLDDDEIEQITAYMGDYFKKLLKGEVSEVHEQCEQTYQNSVGSTITITYTNDTYDDFDLFCLEAKDSKGNSICFGPHGNKLDPHSDFVGATMADGAEYYDGSILQAFPDYPYDEEYEYVPSEEEQQDCMVLWALIDAIDSVPLPFDHLAEGETTTVTITL